MKFIKACFTLVLFTTTLSACDAYRILGMFPLNAKSHNIVFEALLKGLAKRGHRVDVVSHFPLKTPLENYTTIIDLNGTLPSMMNNFTLEYIADSEVVPLQMLVKYTGNNVCQLMGLEQMQRLIRNPPKDPPYDLVITEIFGAHCYMGLGYVLKVPVVAVSSSIEYPWVNSFTGNDDNLAYVPNAFNNNNEIKTFWNRLMNVYVNFVNWYEFHKLTEKNQTAAMRQYLSPDIPSIREVEKNVSLTLINNHPILTGVKPLAPLSVQIAGLHIEENDEILSPALQNWMDESSHGVVYFSFGSMVLIESMSVDKLEDIYASFKKIAPIKVLMKIVNSTKLPPGLPDNVKVLPWIPQQPVLAHPNTKVFITHGGLGGALEGLYYAVPMIGIPLFGDQFRNVESFVSKGMMIRINLEDLSQVLLDDSLEALLHNSTYKEKIVYYSKLFRDEPISPMNKAIFWIEYVIRNGGAVLKSPALKLPWWQLAMLDIYGLVLLTLVLSLVIFIYIFKLAVKKLKNFKILSSSISKKIK